MKIDRTELLDLAEEEDITIYPDYSGRGMFGRQCIGVVGSPSDLVRFITDVIPRIESSDDELGAQASAWLYLQKDDMGLDSIFYWPNIQAVNVD